MFSALCYAEFAARIPSKLTAILSTNRLESSAPNQYAVSGSAYTFSYVSLGEIVAWM